MAENIAGIVSNLRTSVATNQRLRADAETRVALSKQRLDQIDDRLRELGINPDNVDEELQELKNQFTILAEKVASDLREESVTYNAIIEKTKPAFSGEGR